VTGGLTQPAFGRVTRAYRPTRVISADQVEAIPQAALKVLAEIGIRVLNAPARALYAAAGGTAADQMVRLDPELVAERLRTVPARFALAARNPARNPAFWRR